MGYNINVLVNTMAEPILKWVGGKRQLLPKLV